MSNIRISSTNNIAFLGFVDDDEEVTGCMAIFSLRRDEATDSSSEHIRGLVYPTMDKLLYDMVFLPELNTSPHYVFRDEDGPLIRDGGRRINESLTEWEF